MQLHLYKSEEIVIRKNRQRREFNAEKTAELAASIADNGIIHPIVVRTEDKEVVLVVGERRMKALEICWNLGQEVRCGQRVIPEGVVPCVQQGEMDPVDAYEMELEENIRRTDLNWKETAMARHRLMELRTLQATRDGTSMPTARTIAVEVAGTAEGQFGEDVRQDLLLARALTANNQAIATAPSRKEAFKALKRDEERRRNIELGAQIGLTFGAHLHNLMQGDAKDLLPRLEGEFDVILTDPPYGIAADEFGDSGGKAAGAHLYEDSYDYWRSLMDVLIEQGSRLCKPSAHAYVFCDIEHFLELRLLFGTAGWEVFRTPLIWINPSAMRLPWPERGPQRKWQMLMYAVRGGKNVTRIYPDCITATADPNLGNSAQKPVALLMDLLRRTVRPGDAVLDPFAGTGPIFPAAHAFKCRATGIELDPACYAVAAKRIKELK